MHWWEIINVIGVDLGIMYTVNIVGIYTHILWPFPNSTILICLDIGDPVRVVLVMYVLYDFILASEVRLFLDIGESWHGDKSWLAVSGSFLSWWEEVFVLPIHVGGLWLCILGDCVGIMFFWGSWYVHNLLGEIPFVLRGLW